MRHWIVRAKLPRALALAALTSLSLAACSTGPRTDLAWDANDELHQPRPKPRPRFATAPVRHTRVVSVKPTSLKPASVRFGSVKSEPRIAAIPVPRPKPDVDDYDVAWQSAVIPPIAGPTDDPAPIAHPPVEIADAGPAPISSTIGFKWPLAGRIILSFGANSNGERNDGINIAAVKGEPIHAAASGTVGYCGNELKGYGNLVLLRHEGGYVTAYAHADSVLVTRGDHVIAGQVIAYTGETGDVKTPQLHFEIRHGVHPLDPRALLPRSVVVASN